MTRGDGVRAQPGTLGIWAHAEKLSPELARQLEQLGYGAVWIGGSPSGDLAIVDELLDATEQLVVATGIVNIWKDPARTVAASHHRITRRFPRRFVLGVGVGHPEATSDYQHPYTALVEYLDVLDAEGIPMDERVLAALGPKVLRLAADRTGGAHPYLTTPEHTRQARQLLGGKAFLAPEQKVVLEADSEKARSIGRPYVAKPYLGLRNYLANLRRLGWSDDDFADGGSDALIDALVAHGAAATAAARVREHLDAGADHVAIQLLAEPGADPLTGYRRFAQAFFG
ncbi:MAG TPA: LLM class F420-dependent oxidoreductase [Jatrophihabitans sp.]|nr:LLM class F420-dependent oxidoreductase [Jatrophihabitans sp.]